MGYGDFVEGFQRVQVTIPAGQSLSNAFSLKRAEYVALVMPTAWTAANITFQAAFVSNPQASDWRNVFGASGELVVTADANAVLVLPSSGVFVLLNPIWRETGNGGMWPNLRIRSGTAALPVAQTAARDIVVLAR